MQIKIFTISICDNGSGEEELNRFLRSHRIFDVHHHFVNDGAEGKWCFLIKYLEGKGRAGTQGRQFKEKVDYKNVLEKDEFKRFCTLRKIRKAIAEDEGLPAFAVFTDKQMAELSKNETFTIKAMKKVDGIGEKKAQRYGARILRMLEEQDKDTKE